MNKIHELLIKNMKTIRKKLGYSQQRLAELCSLSPSFIGDVEIGKKFPSANSLLKISESLGLKPYQLFMEKEDKKVFEKFNLLSKVQKDLIDTISRDIEDVVRKYL